MRSTTAHAEAGRTILGVLTDGTTQGVCVLPWCWNTWRRGQRLLLCENKRGTLERCISGGRLRRVGHAHWGQKAIASSVHRSRWVPAREDPWDLTQTLQHLYATFTTPL